MRSPLPDNRVSKSASGFSLIEVVVALGIVAIALIPILAMLPMSLEIQTEANQVTTVAQMNKAILDQIRSAEFSELEQEAALQLSNANPILYYFDVEGQSVESNDSSRVYDARARIVWPLQLPANQTSASPNYNAAAVTIDIAHNPGMANNIFDEPKNYSRMTAHLFRNDER